MIQQKIDRIIKNLKAFCDSTGRSKVVIGLSGGIDSALTAKLATMALGAENVTGIMMPNDRLTHPQNVEDAENLANLLGINYKVAPISPFIETFEYLPWAESPIAKMNIQPRVRANILYHFANSHDALVLGTGNKTESMLGYSTKYGDSACDAQVIASLYKTEVWEASRLLELPKEIIEKTPSAELAEGQTDESDIGMSYQEMDEILQKIEAGEKLDEKS